MNHLGFLFAANAFVWAGVIVYLITLKKRNHALKRDLDLLKEAFDKESGQ